jgi:hypothetical protein
MQQIIDGTVSQLVFIINPAPFIREDSVEEGEMHRGNTPWLIHLPALGVTVQALNHNGEPKVGYYDYREAMDHARQIWNRCVEDPSIIEGLRTESASYWPGTVHSDGKIMFRYIDVQPLNL